MAVSWVESSADGIRSQPAPRIRVRRATPEDLPVVIDLKQRMSAEERAPIRLDATLSDWQRDCFGAVARMNVLVAEQADAMAGFAIFSEQAIAGWATPAIYLQDIFVLPERRKRGIGSALMMRVAAEAQARHARLLFLNVHESNPARRLYDGLGFDAVQHCLVYALVGARIGALAACAPASVALPVTGKE